MTTATARHLYDSINEINQIVCCRRKLTIAERNRRSAMERELVQAQIDTGLTLDELLGRA